MTFLQGGCASSYFYIRGVSENKHDDDDDDDIKDLCNFWSMALDGLYCAKETAQSLTPIKA